MNLPDARDGLRPVDRKILLVMTGGPTDRPYRRSASIVGEVRQRFPGQGWRSAYDALVRMTQVFSRRYPLIDGQGNFGSIEGDPVAAPAYTEARLTDFGAAVASDDRRAINADLGPGEPHVLSSWVPNLLVNGASTAETNVPPHNVSEVVGALIHLIDHPGATASDIRTFIKGPDFPTGARVHGLAGIRDYQETGRGTLIVRARTEIETSWDETRVVITEIPTGTDASSLIASIADALRSGRIEGIRDLRNEYSRDGLRIVVTPKSGVDAQALLDNLYGRTPMQSTANVSLVASVLDDRTGRLAPRTMSLKEILEQYIAHRDQCIAGQMDSRAPTSKKERMQILKEELARVAATFGDRRRTEIVDAFAVTVD